MTYLIQSGAQIFTILASCRRVAFFGHAFLQRLSAPTCSHLFQILILLRVSQPELGQRRLGADAGLSLKKTARVLALFYLVMELSLHAVQDATIFHNRCQICAEQSVEATCFASYFFSDQKYYDTAI
jgi:hypothetical protein